MTGVKEPSAIHLLPICLYTLFQLQVFSVVCTWTLKALYVNLQKDMSTFSCSGKYSFSRWVEAWPMKTQTATEIARQLHDEVFCRYGAAIEIISDKGRNFLSKLVNAVCEIYQVNRHSTRSYRPQSNGCVERQNASVVQTIRMYVDRSQRNWHLVLPVALMSLRNAPNLETSGFSPFSNAIWLSNAHSL